MYYQCCEYHDSFFCTLPLIHIITTAFVKAGFVNFSPNSYVLLKIKTYYLKNACLPLSDLNSADFLKFVINGDWSDGLAG